MALRRGEHEPAGVLSGLRGRAYVVAVYRGIPVSDVPADLKDVGKICVEIELQFEIDELVNVAGYLDIFTEPRLHHACAGDDEAPLGPIAEVRIREHVDGALMVKKSTSEKDEWETGES
jgi:hypothetical protein